MDNDNYINFFSSLCHSKTVGHSSVENKIKCSDECLFIYFSQWDFRKYILVFNFIYIGLE